jgi:hypothetical protein
VKVRQPLRLFRSVLVVMLSLVAGSPVPDDPNRLISFAVTTPTPTPTTSLAEVHQNLSSVCETMLPDHGGSSPQSSAAPYKVSASPVTVKLGGVVSGQFLSRLPPLAYNLPSGGSAKTKLPATAERPLTSVKHGPHRKPRVQQLYCFVSSLRLEPISYIGALLSTLPRATVDVSAQFAEAAASRLDEVNAFS